MVFTHILINFTLFFFIILFFNGGGWVFNQSPLEKLAFFKIQLQNNLYPVPLEMNVKQKGEKSMGQGWKKWAVANYK